ncbi:MAG: hypothetical protein SGJ20_13225 [Planctomycetota bacterium]|nr:hypothetical protein [Planctomycetota bacterium]
MASHHLPAPEILWAITAERAREFCLEHDLSPLSDHELDYLADILTEELSAEAIFEGAMEGITLNRLHKLRDVTA